MSEEMNEKIDEIVRNSVEILIRKKHIKNALEEKIPDLQSKWKGIKWPTMVQAYIEQLDEGDYGGVSGYIEQIDNATQQILIKTPLGSYPVFYEHGIDDSNLKYVMKAWEDMMSIVNSSEDLLKNVSAIFTLASRSVLLEADVESML